MGAFLNQQKGKNGSKNYFMINLHESLVTKLGYLQPLDLQSGALPTALWGPVGIHLTLVLLNKLRCHSFLIFSQPGNLIQIVVINSHT